MGYVLGLFTHDLYGYHVTKQSAHIFDSDIMKILLTSVLLDMQMNMKQIMQ